MSRERRRNIYLVVFFVVGVAVSAALFWLIENWNKERNNAEMTRDALAWGHSVSREVENTSTSLQSAASLLAGLPRMEHDALRYVVDSLLKEKSITAVAWAPGVTEDNLFGFLDTYPQFSFEERRFKTILPVARMLYPVTLLRGESDILKSGLELGQDQRWSEPLKTALLQTVPHPEVVSSGEDALILLFQPAVGKEGDSLGLLVAQLKLSSVIAGTSDQGSGELGLRVYDSYPPDETREPLYQVQSETAGSQVTTVPLQVGDERWSLNFFAQQWADAVSWEAVLAGLFGLVSTLTVLMYTQSLFNRETESQALMGQTLQELDAKEKACQDLTNQLEKAEERYSDIFEKSQALIWTMDLKGYILSLNPAAANSLGYRPDEMKRKPLRDFVLPTERHTFSTFLERCTKSESTRGLLKLYTKNGATRFWMYQTSLSQDDEAVRCHALDVTESQQAERELERLSRRNELILESVGEGIYGINLAGECTFVNPAATNFTGYTKEELMSASRTVHEILQPEKVDGSDYPWEDSASYETLSDGEIRRVAGEAMVRKDGSRFPVDYVVTPIVEDDSRILGAVVTFQDVTARRAVEQMKNEFISIVSHELRTPLTSIRGSLGLLASGLLLKFPDKADKMLKIAVENTDRLVRLINDILDIERLESGKVTVEQKELELGTLMKSATETMQAMANENSVKLKTKPLKETVWADSDRILQVLTNLLSNAIKFSEADGDVELRAVVLDGDDEGWVRVEVADTGRGIPADKLDKIFERFGQVDASDSREKGGTGLGLPICRTIVEQHGGSLWVESEAGSGSTFQFTLPMQPPTEE